MNGITGQCAVCGTTENLTREHIIPKFLGGGRSSGDFVYLCAAHNMDFATSTVGAVETDFIHYLFGLMVDSGEFTSVKPQQLGRAEPSFMADIIARKTHSKASSLVAIECKVQAFLSKERVEAALRPLLKIRESDAGAKLILALPGRISQDGQAFLKQYVVELWDIDYISSQSSKNCSNQGPLRRHISNYSKNLSFAQRERKTGPYTNSYADDCSSYATARH